MRLSRASLCWEVLVSDLTAVAIRLIFVEPRLLLDSFSRIFSSHQQHQCHGPYTRSFASRLFQQLYFWSGDCNDASKLFLSMVTSHRAWCSPE